VKAQAQAGARLLDGVAHVVEALAVVAEEQHVVHVPKVRAHPQSVLGSVVHRRKVAVGEVLAREVADGQPHGAREGREQVVPGKVKAHGRDALGASRENDAAHFECALAGHLATELGEQDALVDRREELADVEVQREAVGSCPPRGSPKSRVRPETDAASIGVADQTAIQQRADRVAKGLVHDAIDEGGGHDGARLGVTDRVRRGPAGPPGACAQLVGEPEHGRLQVQQCTSDALAVALAPGRAASGVPKLAHGSPALEQTAHRASGFGVSARSQPPTWRPQVSMRRMACSCWSTPR
jgi:hypothetical protein